MLQIKGEGYENIAFYRITPSTEEVSKQQVEELLKPIGVVEITVHGTIHIDEEILPAEGIRKIESDPNVEPFVNRIISAAIEDPTDWKNPAVRAYETNNEGIAMFLAYAITTHHGGAWVIRQEKKAPYKTVYYVFTLGYYHYVGA